MNKYTKEQDNLMEKVTIIFGNRETMESSHETIIEHTTGTTFLYGGKYLAVTKGFETITYPTDSIIGIKTEVETS